MSAWWQPIETAPKDGTWVLVGHWYSGRWVYRLAAFNAAPHMQSWHDMPGRQVSYATHWQPLPAAPSCAAEDGN